MTIKLGDRFPDTKLTLATADGPKETTSAALFGGAKVVLFAVPGAFTPTCSEQHLPGYAALAERFAEKGVKVVACLAVNDVFVLRAWARSTGTEGQLTMIADGSGTLTHLLGLELDLTPRGLGVRAQRFAMVLDDMKVVHLAVEPPGGYGVSAAEQVIEKL